MPGLVVDAGDDKGAFRAEIVRRADAEPRRIGDGDGRHSTNLPRRGSNASRSFASLGLQTRSPEHRVAAGVEDRPDFRER
jgi:hypothetical protein